MQTKRDYFRKKPLLLSSEKWNSILKHMGNSNSDQTIQEQNYNEYLKIGSRQMKKLWNNRTAKNVEMLDKSKIKNEEKIIVGQRLLEIKENDEKIRQERISKAEKMIKRLEPGPRSLESAAMMSEILKSREIQLEMENNLKKINQKQKMQEIENLNKQTLPWIEEEQYRIMEAKSRNEEYRKELLECIKMQNKNKKLIENVKLQDEKKIRELYNQNMQSQKSQEQNILQQKKENLNQVGLESIKSNEVRRTRQQIESQAADEINMAFIKFKQETHDMEKLRQRKALFKKMCDIDKKAKTLFQKQPNIGKIENERYEKEITENKAKFEAQEVEKLRLQQELKDARIQYFEEEKRKQNEICKQNNEKIKWAVANRLKNKEVNEDFITNQREEKIKKARDVRIQLLNQMQERQANTKLEKVMDIKCNTFSFDDKDTFFFNYANELLENAEKKSRPVYPLKKVIKEYKKYNNLKIESHLPRHLISKVPIGENYANK